VDRVAEDTSIPAKQSAKVAYRVQVIAMASDRVEVAH